MKVKVVLNPRVHLVSQEDFAHLIFLLLINWILLQFSNTILFVFIVLGSISYQWRSTFLFDHCWFGVYPTIRTTDRVCYNFVLWHLGKHEQCLRRCIFYSLEIAFALADSICTYISFLSFILLTERSVKTLLGYVVNYEAVLRTIFTATLKIKSVTRTHN